MKQRAFRLRIGIAGVAVMLIAAHAAAAGEGGFVGIDLGFSEATNDNYRAHAGTGVTGNPFAGYMFTDNLGLQGQIHITEQKPDNDHRGFPRENQTTTLLGGSIGPRIAIPLGEVIELYGTGQGGYFTGLSGAMRHSAPGFSVGGGIDFNLSPQFAIGLFGRWNRVYMSPQPTFLVGQVADQQGPADARWTTGGISLKYSFNRPEAPPPPPPPPPPVVAKAPTPAPVPPVKKKLVLRGVNFDFDKSNIRPDARPILDEAIVTLKQEGSVAVIAEGHTDGKGTVPYNQKLSVRRATAVRDYLVAGGIAADRVSVEGFGKSRPVASNDTEDGRAQNRRVELQIRSR